MEYYVKLFELFAKATGRKITKENYKKMYTRLRSEFIEWLYYYKKMTYEYRMYLQQYYNIDLDNSSVVELGKGNIDSVVREEALMVTPYGYTFTDLYHKDSKLIITDDNVRIDFGICKENTNGINLYITQNPYLYTNSVAELKQLHDLHNENIILGMYGKTYDYDRESKIKLLKQFRRGINSENQEYDLDYYEQRDNYFCTIAKK